MTKLTGRSVQSNLWKLVCAAFQFCCLAAIWIKVGMMRQSILFSLIVIASSGFGVFPILTLVLHNTDQHPDFFLSWFLIAFDKFEAGNLVFLLCFVCATLLLLIVLVFGTTTLRINSLIYPIRIRINVNEPFWPSPQVEVLIQSGAGMAYLHNSSELQSRPPLWKRPTP